LGGSALLIYGTPSPDLLTPRAAPRSLADRMLGRHPVSGPTETPVGSDRALLEIPSDPLRPLADDFRGYLARAFDDPWPATTNVRDYLAMDVATTNVRGDRSGTGVASWYFQLTFSACAGMADTSAEVAAHWAEIWFRRNRDELASKYFLPFGFTPERADLTGPAKLFVPLGRMGYAQFNGIEEVDDPEVRNFQLDWAVLEPLSEVDLTQDWQELDEALRDVRAAGLCLCQFCAPQLDLSRFEQLSIVERQPE
jgi:hypothetical protein